MKTTSIQDLIIFWNPLEEGLPCIAIRPLKPWGINKHFPYRSSWGGCNTEISKEESFEKRKALLLLKKKHFIVHGKCDRTEVHEALSRITEYGENK